MRILVRRGNLINNKQKIIREYVELIKLTITILFKLLLNIGRIHDGSENLNEWPSNMKQHRRHRAIKTQIRYFRQLVTVAMLKNE